MRSLGNTHMTIATLSIAAPSVRKAEGNAGLTPFTFTVTRAGNTSLVSSANWLVAGAGPDAASAADFIDGVFPSGVIVFASGEASKTITVFVPGARSGGGIVIARTDSPGRSKSA